MPERTYDHHVVDGARRRDRHGRGIRGPARLPGSPSQRTRPELFEDIVRAAWAQLERKLPDDLAPLHYAIETVPTAISALDEPSAFGASLGRVDRAPTGSPTIVLHRKAIEDRSSPGTGRRGLVGEVLVELIAEALGREPEEIDPGYPD